MKRILVTVVLGLAALAAVQDAVQSAQGQSSASTKQAPVIKNPAEYLAYKGAVQQTDPTAKINGLEAFVTQYPDSVMKNQALEILMGTYQQTGNVKKTRETAMQLVIADACNVRGLALLSYFDRVLAQAGDPSATQLLVDGKKYGQQGLDCLPKVTDADVLKMKDMMTGIFNAVIGISAWQDNDYATSVRALRKAVDLNPEDFSVVYPLALSYLGQTPPDYQNGIWYAARASALAPPAAQAQIENYAHSQYVKAHAGEDGWPELFAQAKVGPTPLGFTLNEHVSAAPAQPAGQQPESQGENGEISGRVFLITQGGDLKPARLVDVILLAGSDADTAATVYENNVLENLKASYQDLARPGEASCQLRLLVDTKALGSTFEWAKKNGKMKQIQAVGADEDGYFDFPRVQPGPYTLLARGRAGANNAHWESDNDIKVKAGQSVTVKLGSPKTACLD